MKVRLFALLSAVGLLVLAAAPASASSHGRGYLALGDSVAFGYSPLLDPRVASNFIGYPDIVAQTLNTSVVNPSCPGETTGGFISLTNGADYLCLPWRNAPLPLHVAYSTSQLDFTIAYLQAHPETKLVTIDLGANDVFKLVAACGGQNTPCFANGISGVLAAIDTNLRFIFGEIRNVAHYHHALVVLTYYSLSYDQATAMGTQLLNAPIIDAANAYGGIVASGFDAFEGPALNHGLSSCAAGLLILLSDGTCNVHPSPQGRDLLAAAVVKAIAESCPAASVNGCLDRNQF